MEDEVPDHTIVGDEGIRHVVGYVSNSVGVVAACGKRIHMADHGIERAELQRLVTCLACIADTATVIKVQALVDLPKQPKKGTVAIVQNNPEVSKNGAYVFTSWDWARLLKITP